MSFGIERGKRKRRVKMKKQGPCRHCGITSTPLWRNGPPEKPVLCNACGSRWRTKGSLTNYIPLHAREDFDSNELKVPKLKHISFKQKEEKLHKEKQTNYALESECEMQYCDQNFHKIIEGDASNRSSSGSAISGSDSCLHFGTNDASDVTGSVQSNMCDTLVQSKKRTFNTRPKLSVEKLTKDLYSILHEEQASNLSITTEDDLLFSCGTPLGSFEIGYGGVLLKHSNSKSVDEESEASSFPVDKSSCVTEGYSGSTFFPVNNESKRFLNSGDNIVKSAAQLLQGKAKRDTIGHDKLTILQQRNSPLTCADLEAVINFEGFTKYLVHEEQQKLMKYLPSIDIAKPPESLKSMFTSSQFLETLSWFQKLLQEGVFDLSMAGIAAENCRVLKKLVLLSCTKFKWIECYKNIKDGSSKKMKGGNKTSITAKVPDFSSSTSLKRQRDDDHQNFSELKSIIRSPKRVCRTGHMNPPSKCSTQLDSSVVTKVNDDIDDLANDDGACFSPRRTFSSPDRNSTLAPMQFIADSSDCDMLLEVPTGTSFREAELLHHQWEQKTNQTGSSTANVAPVSDLPFSSISNK